MMEENRNLIYGSTTARMLIQEVERVKSLNKDDIEDICKLFEAGKYISPSTRRLCAHLCQLLRRLRLQDGRRMTQSYSH